MWILPTYNRPELLNRTLAKCTETGVSTKGVILINGGDYNIGHALPKGWEIITVPENLGWAQGCNYVFEKYPNEPWYGFFYDDMAPVTEGWDTRLVQGLNDKVLISSAENNWHKPARIQTAVINGDLVRECGFLCLPETWACFTDDFWERIGRELGCWQVQDVVVETLNPRKGDYEEDDAHKTAYKSGNYEKDAEIWDRFQQTEFRPLRERIREALNVGQPRKVKLSQHNVWIGTPSIDGKIESAYVASLVRSFDVLNRLNVGHAIYILDKCSILPHARNRLVGEFLHSDASHMLFIDDDMGWPDNAIPELLAHDKDVIGAVGITKDEDPEKRHFCAGLDPKVTKFDHERGIIRVAYVGTGFLLIKRHVLEKMWTHYRKWATQPPPDHPEIGPCSRIFEFDYTQDVWGEDYIFCQRWRELGGEIWVDPSIRLEHIGSHCYTGTYLEWLEEKHRKDAAA